MKKIYSSDNVKKTLLSVQKRMCITTNRTYKTNDIIYAFNKLPGRYQDLLLKIDKNENDKANLDKVYNMIKLTLVKSKDIPDDIKVDIKNINIEEEKKKDVVSLEDVEVSGDKWVREEPKKKPIFVKELEIPKVEKPMAIKKDNLVKVEKEESTKEEIVEKTEEKKDNKQVNYKEIVLKKYIEQRKGLNINEILDDLNINEEDRFIIESKFDNNSVVPNEELEKAIGIRKNYIEEVIDRFYDKAIENTKKKLLALERK